MPDTYRHYHRVAATPVMLGPDDASGTIPEAPRAALTRRQALRIGLLPLALWAMPRLWVVSLVAPCDSATEQIRSWDWFRALFTDLRPPRALGRSYLELFSQERDRAFLQSAIIGTKRPRDVNHLRALLAQRREHDFRTGDVAIVDGWVLSRSEARACALIALL
jgi:hypothetical protein